ncbi:MAG TPA: hypothetical protein VMW01_07840 [Williamwhitmania sp.]|nr:hypothetical protein [Williamwhitmania sp.]
MVALLLLKVTVSAQDLSTIGKGNPLKINGGFSFNNYFFFTDQESSRKAFSYIVSGNVNAQIYSFNIPFNFSYTNQQVAYSQPFNFNHFGAQPSYKWIKTYVGYNSLSYSPYTYSGIQFLGFGVEVAPPSSPIKVSTFYGRLIKGVDYDTTRKNTPYFERFGWGTKIELGLEKTPIQLIIFRAWDKQSSIGPLPDSLLVYPKDNLALELKVSHKITKRFEIMGGISGSELTNDTRQSLGEGESVTPYSKLFPFFRKRSSTTYRKAVRTGFNYTAETGTVGIAYERVDPDYATLGCYYFTNDFENYTLNFTKMLNKGKVNLSGNLGYQLNNIESKKLSTTHQIVGSLNSSVVVTPKLNLNVGYSNFTSYTNIRSPFDVINATSPYQNLDTLNFSQISQTAFCSVLYLLSNSAGGDRKSLNFTTNYQTAVSVQEGSAPNVHSDFYNIIAAYSQFVKQQELNLTASLCSNINRVSGSPDAMTIGPVISVTKSLLQKKLKLTFSSAFNVSTTAWSQTSRNLNFRLGGTYTIKKKHNIAMNITTYQQNTKAGAIKERSDLSATVGYNYNF